MYDHLDKSTVVLLNIKLIKRLNILVLLKW